MVKNNKKKVLKIQTLSELFFHYEIKVQNQIIQGTEEGIFEQRNDNFMILWVNFKKVLYLLERSN